MESCGGILQQVNALFHWRCLEAEALPLPSFCWLLKAGNKLVYLLPDLQLFAIHPQAVP